MAQAASKGNCYLCGRTISKTAFKKHLLEKHNDAVGDAQTCKLLKVEGADEKAYWLYLDMPMSATLKTLDRFLRDIWLECCGHESYNGADDHGGGNTAAPEAAQIRSSAREK